MGRVVCLREERGKTGVLDLERQDRIGVLRVGTFLEFLTGVLDGAAAVESIPAKRESSRLSKLRRLSAELFEK